MLLLFVRNDNDRGTESFLLNLVEDQSLLSTNLIFSKYLNNSAFSLDQQERREDKLRERIQVLEEEKEELKEKEVERRGARQEKEDEEGGGRHEKDEKGKECVEDTERMLLAVLRELEGIPRYLCLLITSFSKLFFFSPLKARF